MTVAMTANESMVAFTLGFVPVTGSKAVDTSPFFFLRNYKNPITNPTIAKTDH